MRVLLAGLATVDLVQRVEAFPEPGDKVRSTSAALAAGGPAANAAVTVSVLGGRASLATVLGRHPLADSARADLEEYGVRVLDLLPDAPGPPPVSAATVRDSDGERTVVSLNAAAVGEPPFSSRAADTWADVDAVLVDGHYPAVALGVTHWARRRGLPVVVDAGSWRPVFADVLPLADVVACSERFTAPEGMLDAVPTVIRTAGAEPVRWHSGGVSGEVAVPGVVARDTLGAGDVWHGALVARVGSLDVPELIEFANAVAAERVRHVGPRSWTDPVRAMMGVT